MYSLVHENVFTSHCFSYFVQMAVRKVACLSFPNPIPEELKGLQDRLDILALPENDPNNRLVVRCYLEPPNDNIHINYLFDFGYNSSAIGIIRDLSFNLDDLEHFKYRVGGEEQSVTEATPVPAIHDVWTFRRQLTIRFIS